MRKTDEPGRGSGELDPVAGVPLRGRGAVAASILGILLIGGFFAAAPGGIRTPLGEYLLHAAILTVAFWLPAMRIGSVRDVLRQWKALVAWILAWTLAWDAATAGIFLRRELFQEWWIVYPSGLLTLAVLLLFHGAIMDWLARRRWS
jgi:hypothetical protein